MHEPGVETIVLDNASHDGSPQAVAAVYPEVRLICSETNLGFAAGVRPDILRLAPGLAPGLFGFAAIFSGNRAGRIPQVLGRFPRVHFAALEFVLRIPSARRSM